MSDPLPRRAVPALTRAADRLDELADTAELMGDPNGADRLRRDARRHRVEAMHLLDESAPGPGRRVPDAGLTWPGMSDAMPPWEPPFAGTDVEHLVGSLEWLRATFRWKAGGLDAEGLAFRLPSSALSLGGLLKHLAFAEDLMFTRKLSGEPQHEPWASVDFGAVPDWEFTSAADDPPDALYALWDATVERSRRRLAAAIAEGGLDQPVAWGRDVGIDVSLRRLVCDLIEEYGRHTGHADLLREAVDGLTGEDPPWP